MHGCHVSHCCIVRAAEENRGVRFLMGATFPKVPSMSRPIQSSVAFVELLVSWCPPFAGSGYLADPSVSLLSAL